MDQRQYWLTILRLAQDVSSRKQYVVDGPSSWRIFGQSDATNWMMLS